MRGERPTESVRDAETESVRDTERERERERQAGIELIVIVSFVAMF